MLAQPPVLLLYILRLVSSWHIYLLLDFVKLHVALNDKRLAEIGYECDFFFFFFFSQRWSAWSAVRLWMRCAVRVSLRHYVVRWFDRRFTIYRLS